MIVILRLRSGKNCTLYPRYLGGYRTEIDQISTRQSRIIAMLSGLTIFKFVVERQNNIGGQFRRLQNGTKINWLP